MSDTICAVQIDCSYSNTDYERSYRMNNVNQNDLSTVDSKVQAINASLAAGTAGGLSSTFVSEDFTPGEGKGYLEKINRAVKTVTIETDIPF